MNSHEQTSSRSRGTMSVKKGTKSTKNRRQANRVNLCLSAVGLSFLSVFACGLFLRLRVEGEGELERCAAVGVGLGPEVAAVAGHDRAADR